MQKNELIKQLNAEMKEQRIDAIRQLKKRIQNGEIKLPQKEGFTKYLNMSILSQLYEVRHKKSPR